MKFEDDKELYEYKTNYRIKLVKEITKAALQIISLITLAIVIFFKGTLEPGVGLLILMLLLLF